MDNTVKVVLASVILSMFLEIRHLKKTTKENNDLIWELPRHIRKTYPSDYDVEGICKRVIKNSTINVCDEKGTDE